MLAGWLGELARWVARRACSLGDSASLLAGWLGGLARWAARRACSLGGSAGLLAWPAIFLYVRAAPLPGEASPPPLSHPRQELAAEAQQHEEAEEEGLSFGQRQGRLFQLALLMSETLCNHQGKTRGSSRVQTYMQGHAHVHAHGTCTRVRMCTVRRLITRWPGELQGLRNYGRCGD